MSSKDRVVLAYSGGLDTSVAIGWIGEQTGREVVAVAVDVGQGGEDLEVIRQRALDCGAVEAYVADARDEFASEYCMPALKASTRSFPRCRAPSSPSTWSRPPANSVPPPSPTAAPARVTTRSASRSPSLRWPPTWTASPRCAILP